MRASEEKPDRLRVRAAISLCPASLDSRIFIGVLAREGARLGVPGADGWKYRAQ